MIFAVLRIRLNCRIISSVNIVRLAQVSAHLNGRNGHYKDMQRDRFTLGDEEEDDDDDHARRKRG